MNDYVNLDILNSYKPVSYIDQKLLFQQMKKGDTKAREKIIVNNIPLVFKEALISFKTSNYDKEELISVGLIGLIKAVDNYKIDYGYAFSTFAVKCIHNEIYMYFRNENKHKNKCANLYEKISENNKNCNVVESIENIEQQLEEKEGQEKINKIINNYVNNINHRDKTIMEMYFGLNGSKTYKQKEIANLFGLRQCQISKIIKKHLINIKEMIQKKTYIEQNFTKKL